MESPLEFSWTMTKLVSMAFLYYHIKSIISHNIYSFHADVLDDN